MSEKHDHKKSDQPLIDADAFEREVTTDLDEETPDKPKGLPLHSRILITAATFVARSEGYELLRRHEPAIVHAGVEMPIVSHRME